MCPERSNRYTLAAPATHCFPPPTQLQVAGRHAPHRACRPDATTRPPARGTGGTRRRGTPQARARLWLYLLLATLLVSAFSHRFPLRLLPCLRCLRRVHRVAVVAVVLTVAALVVVSLVEEAHGGAQPLEAVLHLEGAPRVLHLVDQEAQRVLRR